jgi:hypothetical protein
MHTIYIDADACPVKDEVYRAARRYALAASSLQSGMRRQQLQGSFGIFSLKAIQSHRANRKPDIAGENSVFFAPLNSIDPISADGLSFDKDNHVMGFRGFRFGEVLFSFA